MNKSVLQIPLSRSLRKQAEEKAMEQGFSSLQEFVRVMLNRLSRNLIEISILPKEEKLSPAAEKRYIKMLHDREMGNNWNKANNIDDLFHQLNED